MAYFQPKQSSLNSTDFPDYSSSDFVTGLKMTHTSNTTFTISSGAAKAYNSNFIIAMPASNPETAFSVTVNTDMLGAFGCYPHLPAIAAPTHNTSFGVYILGNTKGTTNGSRVSSNTISPTVIVATGDNFLLPGYDTYRRIGTVWFTAGTNHLIYTNVTGCNNTRNYSLNNAVPIVVSQAPTIYTLVDLGSATNNLPCSPVLTTKLSLGITYTPTVASNTLNIVPDIAPTVIVPTIDIRGQVDGVLLRTVCDMVPGINLGDVSFWYKTSAGSDVVTIYLIGWQEDLSLSAI